MLVGRVCVVTRVALSQVSHTPDIIPNRRPGRYSPKRACDPVYRQTRQVAAEFTQAFFRLGAGCCSAQAA